MTKCRICGEAKPMMGVMIICKKCGFIVCSRHFKKIRLDNPLIGSPNMICPNCNARRPVRKIE